MDADADFPRPAGELLIRVPAHRDFVASIRAMTRSAAVLCDLSVDDVEDLQMAVDEAATVLLPLVDDPATSSLEATFDVTDDELRINLSARCADGAAIDRTGLAWAMLSALDPGVSEARDGSNISISISRPRASVAP